MKSTTIEGLGKDIRLFGFREVRWRDTNELAELGVKVSQGACGGEIPEVTFVGKQGGPLVGRHGSVSIFVISFSS